MELDVLRSEDPKNGGLKKKSAYAEIFGQTTRRILLKFTMKAAKNHNSRPFLLSHYT